MKIYKMIKKAFQISVEEEDCSLSVIFLINLPLHSLYKNTFQMKIY